ncbi:putative ankyrin repeat protein RF_0381, partial [Artemia franciscana]|uniref:putative ankyrin repeat protein RF_0381 n=1 Tax=Artemia franciscana TaxID=6661 RepID=UPI0032DB732B
PSQNLSENVIAALVRHNRHNRHKYNNYSVGTLKNYLKLLENELNPNEYEFVKPTCFGNLKLRRQLVSNCDTIDAKDNQGRTALSKAVICNNLTVTAHLLENGANPNARGFHRDETVLHVASRNGNLNICQLLVLNGATIDASDYGVTPLSYAVAWNHISVTRYLLEKGANPNTDYPTVLAESLLDVAVGNSNFDICQLLISKGADVNCLTSNNETPLMIALNNILSYKIHHLSNIAITIIEYLLESEAVCNSKKVEDIKDKYREIFKQVLASNPYHKISIDKWYRIMGKITSKDYHKIPIDKWYSIMCKITSQDYGSLKSICRDVILKN